ncbi:MAG TPA: nucleotide exchange factor GrpE [Bacteroidetes bacterium]|nr:nucleotide exchange factor GrpE [Bacteroidota bacterium]
MTREEFKQYILAALEALPEGQLEQLLPNSQQPDLYTIAREVTGLKGEVKKLAGSSLRLNQEIRGLLELTQDSTEEKDAPNPEELEKENRELKANLQLLLQQLIEQDDFITRTAKQLETLPSPGLLTLNNYKTSMAAWEKGFEITVDKWQQFIKSLGLYKTGLPGEPFDPALHEAVAVKYDSSQPENNILESEVTGFLYRQSIIRQAKVVVNKRPTPKSVPAPQTLPTPPPTAPPEEPPLPGEPSPYPEKSSPNHEKHLKTKGKDAEKRKRRRQKRKARKKKKRKR